MLKVVGSETAQDDVDGRSLLDEIAREGARRMLVAALETEVAAYLEAHAERDDEGHDEAVVRRSAPTACWTARARGSYRADPSRYRENAARKRPRASRSTMSPWHM